MPYRLKIYGLCVSCWGHTVHMWQKSSHWKFWQGPQNKVNNCVAKWRLGANDTQELPLWASSFLFGWEILATQLWAPCGREESRHRHNENISGKGGGKKPLINWVTTFVIHPRWIKHTKSWQTHQNGWTLNALDHAGPRAWWILVHAHLAHTTGQQVETSAPCC